MQHDFQPQQIAPQDFTDNNQKFPSPAGNTVLEQYTHAYRNVLEGRSTFKPITNIHYDHPGNGEFVKGALEIGYWRSTEGLGSLVSTKKISSEDIKSHMAGLVADGLADWASDDSIKFKASKLIAEQRENGFSLTVETVKGDVPNEMVAATQMDSQSLQWLFTKNNQQSKFLSTQKCPTYDLIMSKVANQTYDILDPKHGDLLSFFSNMDSANGNRGASVNIGPGQLKTLEKNTPLREFAKSAREMANNGYVVGFKETIKLSLSKIREVVTEQLKKSERGNAFLSALKSLRGVISPESNKQTAAPQTQQNDPSIIQMGAASKMRDAG